MLSIIKYSWNRLNDFKLASPNKLFEVLFYYYLSPSQLLGKIDLIKKYNGIGNNCI